MMAWNIHKEDVDAAHVAVGDWMLLWIHKGEGIWVSSVIRLHLLFNPVSKHHCHNISLDKSI